MSVAGISGLPGKVRSRLSPARNAARTARPDTSSRASFAYRSERFTLDDEANEIEPFLCSEARASITPAGSCPGRCAIAQTTSTGMR